MLSDGIERQHILKSKNVTAIEKRVRTLGPRLRTHDEANLIGESSELMHRISTYSKPSLLRRTKHQWVEVFEDPMLAWQIGLTSWFVTESGDLRRRTSDYTPEDEILNTHNRVLVESDLREESIQVRMAVEKGLEELENKYL